MNELQRAVQDLHGRISIQLDIRHLPDRRVEWEATVSGEDFLDGPWESRLGKRISKDKRAMFRRDLPRVLAGKEKSE